MPNVRRLTPDEAQRLEHRDRTGVRAETERLYDQLLIDASINPGDYCEAIVSDGDPSRQTVRKRLLAAAERRGFTLDFMRTTGNVLRFQVQEAITTTDSAAVVFAADP